MEITKNKVYANVICIRRKNDEKWEQMRVKEERALPRIVSSMFLVSSPNSLEILQT